MSTLSMTNEEILEKAYKEGKISKSTYKLRLEMRKKVLRDKGIFKPEGEDYIAKYWPEELEER